VRTLTPSIVMLGILALGLAFVPFGFGAATKNAAVQLFKAKCSPCHGPEGKGIAAMHSPDFTSPKWQATHSDQRILSMITNGEKGTAMPAWKGKRTTAQIRSLMRYIRSLNNAKK
jgi:cytochrome c oxidase cbb3-type subunit III